MDFAIKVENLSKTYKLYDKSTDRLKESFGIKKKAYHTIHYALKDISFEIQKGEAIGVVGKNGSGKSTLLKILTGVLSPTSGNKEIKGKVAAILELGAGFNPEYTGIENIYLNGTMLGYTKQEVDLKMDMIIQFADIGEFIYQPVKTYSSGMFARLAFAVASNVEPDILIVDEALAVGDTRFQIKCIDKMKALKEKGTTILFVSHATEQVKRFCTRTLWIDKGEIKASGKSSEVVDLYDSFMKTGEVVQKDVAPIKEIEENERELIRPSDEILAMLTNVELNKQHFKTFDELSVAIEYEIYEENIEGFLLGVAIYTPSRDYIFGPNTHLDKITIPNKKGRHRIVYTIPRLTLLGGEYVLDVGVFNNEGIVSLDYKSDVLSFKVTNDYFTEGKFFIEHQWVVKK